jgi:hypothetical protein
MKAMFVAIIGLIMALSGYAYAMSPLERWMLQHPGEEIPAWVLIEDSEYVQGQWDQDQRDFEWRRMRRDIDDIRSRLDDPPLRWPR